MTAFQRASSFPRRALPLTILVCLCLPMLTDCFYAKWYEPPHELEGYRVFDDYLVKVHLYNENVRSWDHTRHDDYYYIDVELILKADSTRTDPVDPDRSVRVKNLCISAPCIEYVYCPPLARDTTFESCGKTDGELSCALYHWLQYGAMDLPDQCRTIDASLEAVLTEEASDSVLAVENIRMSMEVKQRAIPAFAPR